MHSAATRYFERDITLSNAAAAAVAAAAADDDDSLTVQMNGPLP